MSVDKNVAQLIEALGVKKPYDLDATLRQLLTELLFARENMRKLVEPNPLTGHAAHCKCFVCIQ